MVVGPDWWACVCCWGADRRDQPMPAAEWHADRFDAELATTGWRWDEVRGVGPDVADLVQWLWEQDALILRLEGAQ